MRRVCCREPMVGPRDYHAGSSANSSYMECLSATQPEHCDQLATLFFYGTLAPQGNIAVCLWPGITTSSVSSPCHWREDARTGQVCCPVTLAVRLGLSSSQCEASIERLRTIRTRPDSRERRRRTTDASLQTGAPTQRSPGPTPLHLGAGSGRPTGQLVRLGDYPSTVIDNDAQLGK